MQTIKQSQLEDEAKRGNLLKQKIQDQIKTLQRQKANADKKAKDGSLPESTRLVWKGMEIAYNNTLSELEVFIRQVSNPYLSL